MFVKKPWKWTMDCWEVTGTWVNTKPAVVSPAKKKVVKEDSPRPRKKARKEASEEASEEAAAVASEETAAEASEEVHTTVGGLTKEDIKTMFKDIVDAMREGFGTCLKEIKYLPERVEAVEKKSESVNGTNTGRKSLPEDKGPDVPADASSSKDKAPEPSLSDRTRKLAASQQSLYTANNTAKVIIPNKKFYPGYNPFAPIDKKKLKEHADWLKTCPTPLDKKPRTSRTWWYQILRTSLEWLEDCINVLRKRYDANPQHFRSERMCFLDHLFAQQWRFNYKDFKDSEPDQNGLGSRLPGGAWNYYAGTIPSFCQSNKVWGTDIDDVYAPVNYNDTHWIAMWISIPKRHIVVWDSICSSISPEELLCLEPFTYERPTNIPPARAGDCGVYTLKYIECHALGIDHYRTPLDKKPRTSRTWWYQILRTSLEWLEDCDANPQHFRSKRMCFLDHLFAQQWRFNFKDFKDPEPDQNGLGRRLPVNYTNTHWIAMWISISKRHIVVFDNICSNISPEELDVTNNVPNTAWSHSHMRDRPIYPPARGGDCGVYALKYIECHALGIEFSKKDFAKPNGKTMRDKMASESVNGTNAGRKSLPEDKGPDVPADASSTKDKAPEPSLVLMDKNQPTVSDLQKEDARYQEKRDAALALCRAKSNRTRKLAASQQSPYTANSTAKVIIPNKKLYPGYNTFAPIDKKKLKELADRLKTCPHYRTPLDNKPRTSRTWWYHILRTFLEWLEDCDFKDSVPDQNDLERRLPGGAWNYYAGTIPSFCQSNKISIPKRHIVVCDSICSNISPEEIDVVMEPFLYMVPYLLVECASSDEQRAQYSLEPFIYVRLTNIPQARAGDCSVYALKYIECHALGMPFSKKDFAKPNRKTMRDKMAVDIFKKLPDAHEFENKDNDAN
ncbi:hypothetical protein F2Q68_00016890 [Brassica cretica]|uniref:Ubiquitin-like protease family profile domain-containing protein n=1 Tax=Brassica cretica TaxID=69181 RepID=A0A8S9HYF5_BRACR|nr:hypothetical protein F2Q68_00016890 [Brassica cretica]